MTNRLFSLLIVPDSGADVKTGSFNFRFILGFFSILVSIFFLCFFVIVGYHIKLSQEKDYKTAVSKYKKLSGQVENTQNTLQTLFEKLQVIQRNDKALRLIASMDIVDDAMYKAGIGGHVIVDNAEFKIFDEDWRVTLDNLAYGVIFLENQLNFEENSFRGIDDKILQNNEIMDNRPSIYPANPTWITSSYSYRIHPITGRRQFHGGIDLKGSMGQPIFATADGFVKLAKSSGLLGNCIEIEHKYGYTTVYGHLSEIQVKVGQKISKREQIGTMGRTGRSTGVHLHYSVEHYGKSQNPVNFLN